MPRDEIERLLYADAPTRDNYNIIILRAGRRPHAAIAFIILFILGGQRRDYYYNISIDFLVHDSPVHPAATRQRNEYKALVRRRVIEAPLSLQYPAVESEVMASQLTLHP